jgi:hypothetical protein
VNRRAFLRTLLWAAPVVAVAPKLIMLPPRGGWPVHFVPQRLHDYDHLGYAMSFTITEEVTEELYNRDARYKAIERYSNPLIPPGEASERMLVALEDGRLAWLRSLEREMR